MESNTYDVIVIGAGISGIASSKILSANKINHLILESRDRVGGRIFSSEFQGIRIQLGASFVHSPNHEKNLIDKYVKKNGFQTISAQYGQQAYFYQNQGILPQKIIEKGWEIYDKFQQYAKKLLETGKDFKIDEAFQNFYNLKLAKRDEHIRNFVRWNVQIYGNIEGAELNELSLKHYAYNNCESSEDYIPNQGYSTLIRLMLSEFNPKILLQHAVTEINYEGQVIAVKTNKNEVFLCKKVISSLPLGVLQQQRVKFNPNLPQQYVNAIKTMGNGVADKLLVSFQKSFWGKRKGWLNFITKSPHNRYRVAMILPTKQKHIICIFVSGQASKQLSKMTDNEITEDLSVFLSKLVKENVEIKDIKLTRWHLDQHSLGSYSFCKGGDAYYGKVKVLQTPIDNKVWFIGEHTEQLNACVHSAYYTGLQAAQKVCQSFTKQ